MVGVIGAFRGLVRCPEKEKKTGHFWRVGRVRARFNPARHNVGNLQGKRSVCEKGIRVSCSELHQEGRAGCWEVRTRGLWMPRRGFSPGFWKTIRISRSSHSRGRADTMAGKSQRPPAVACCPMNMSICCCLEGFCTGARAGRPCGSTITLMKGPVHEW